MAMDRLDAAFVARLGAALRPGPPGAGLAAAMPPTTRVEPRTACPPLPGSAVWIADRIAAEECRVVGIAGAGTTVGLGALAERIGDALATHGWRVAHRTGPVLLHPGDATTDAADVVLVVGGDWFPVGPVNIRRLVGRVCGCAAVVLVRPADRSPCPAHAAALGSLGVLLLATVEATFETPAEATALAVPRLRESAP